jgi:hypothetical protein
MLIQYKTGVREHVSNELGRSQINAGVAVEVKKRSEEPAVVYEPEFAVVFVNGKTLEGGEVLAIQMKIGPTIVPDGTSENQSQRPDGMQKTEYYLGAPEHAHAFRPFKDARRPEDGHWFNGFGRSIPDAIGGM